MKFHILRNRCTDGPGVVCSASNRTKVVVSFEQSNIRRTSKNIGTYLYICTYPYAFLYVPGVYIINIIIYCAVHTWTTHRRFLTVFFLSFRPIHGEENIYRPVRLKTFSGYLGVDLADTKGPQKVICHPLLTRFIRQQKSEKKK